jgi:hypothetical protein
MGRGKVGKEQFDLWKTVCHGLQTAYFGVFF